MVDDIRPVSAENRTSPAYAAAPPSPRPRLAPRTPMVTTGPLLAREDIVAGVVSAIMLLAPLAMAAFWAPYH
jgi:hypothetical protein